MKLILEHFKNNIQLHFLETRSLFLQNIFSVFNQFDAQNLFNNKFLFHASTCFEHMCHHRRSKLLYTASGIITPIGVMIPEAVYYEHMCSKHVES